MTGLVGPMMEYHGYIKTDQGVRRLKRRFFSYTSEPADYYAARVEARYWLMQVKAASTSVLLTPKRS